VSLWNFLRKDLFPYWWGFLWTGPYWWGFNWDVLKWRSSFSNPTEFYI